MKRDKERRERVVMTPCYIKEQADWKGTRIRLADGVVNDSGRVEVWTSKGWGTICQSERYSAAWWDDSEANVVCRQMSYSGGIPLGAGTVVHGDPTQVMFHISADGIFH